MKTALLVSALVSIAAIGNLAFADSAKLILKEEYRCAVGGFPLNASVELHWTQDSPLVINGTKAEDGPMAVMSDIELIDERGKIVPEILTTGPAWTFMISTIVQKGEQRTFPLWTRSFDITSSGTYSVMGKLIGTSITGNPVALNFDKVSFHVTVEEI